jgi:transposase
MKKQIETKNLDHLGLIAGIIDDLQIENIVDSLIEKDIREKISAGKVIKAIIINGLGFLSKPLYLFPNFFADKPVENLLGNGIKAEEINDDKIGRVMDKLYDVSLELLWTKIGLNTIEKFEFCTKFSHLDSTYISVEGEYNNQKNEEKSADKIIKITQGYSRDKRPDLNQFMRDLMVSSDGDVPTFMRIGNGNESDKTIFPLFILDYQKNFDISTIYVADSAFYTAKNIHTMKDLFWISLVPMTIKKAQEIVRKTGGTWVISEISGYKYRTHLGSF